MKKGWVIVLLVSALLLSACGSAEGQITDTGSSSQESRESTSSVNKENDMETSKGSDSVDVGKTATLQSGKYVGGSDIPAGFYALTRSSKSSGSGIVWLSSPEDNLEEEYPSLIYEFVGDDEEVSFFLSLQEGSTLNVPFECLLTSVNYTDLKTGGSIPAIAGTYTGGLDLPIGQYLLVYDDIHTGSGIIWLSAADDDLSSEYPSKIYEFVNSDTAGEWFISLEENGKLTLPFSCKPLTKIEPVSISSEAVDLYPGMYCVGVDIDAGRYNLTCKTNDDNAGIAWVSSPNDNLDEEYPSALYEFIGPNSEESFYITLEEGGKMYLPCEASIEGNSGVNFN